MNLNELVFGASIGEPAGVSVPLSHTGAVVDSEPFDGGGEMVALCVEEENARFDSLSKSLEELIDLKETVLQVGGMSKDFAMEAERLIPDFGGVPMGYYTESPSRTRYAVSLEALNYGMIGMITAAVGVVIAIIYKIFKWLFGDDDKSSSKVTPHQATEKAKEQVADTVEALNVVADTAAATAEVVHDAEKDIHAAHKRTLKMLGENNEAVEFSTMEELFNLAATRETGLLGDTTHKNVGRYLNVRSPLLSDILTKGEFTQAIESLSAFVTVAGSQITMRVEALEKAVKTDLQSEGGPGVDADIRNNMALAAGARVKRGVPLDSIITPELKHRVTLKIGGEELTVQGISAKVTAARHAAETATYPNMTLYQFCKSIGERLSSEGCVKIIELHKTSTELMAKALAKLEEVEKHIEPPSSGSAADITLDADRTSTVSASNAALFRDLLQALRTDAMDMSTVLTMVKMYRHVLFDGARQAFMDLKHVATILKLHVEIDGKSGKELPEGILALVESALTKKPPGRPNSKYVYMAGAFRVLKMHVDEF